MNPAQRVSFINGLNPIATRFLTCVYSALQKEENQILTTGGNPTQYRQAVQNMCTIRLRLLQEIKSSSDYNPQKFIDSLSEAGYNFSSLNHSARSMNHAEVLDHVLAIQSLKALAEISTPEALKKLYLCLVDEEIDSGVRASVISHLADLGKQNPKVLDILTTALEFYESNPEADPDSRTIAQFLVNSIEIIEES